MPAALTFFFRRIVAYKFGTAVRGGHTHWEWYAELQIKRVYVVDFEAPLL